MKKLATSSTDSCRLHFTKLEQIPNVGPAIAADFKLLGVASPRDLIGRDPYALYDELCRLTRFHRVQALALLHSAFSSDVPCRRRARRMRELGDRSRSSRQRFTPIWKYSASAFP